jgi:hypothetical protein
LLGESTWIVRWNFLDGIGEEVLNIVIGASSLAFTQDSVLLALLFRFLATIAIIVILRPLFRLFTLATSGLASQGVDEERLFICSFNITLTTRLDVTALLNLCIFNISLFVGSIL